MAIDLRAAQVWLRRHPRLRDAGLAVALFIVAGLPLTADQPGCDCAVTGWAYLAAAAVSLPVGFRRQAPLMVNLVVVAGALLYALTAWSSPAVPSVPALIVAVVLLLDAATRARKDARRYERDTQRHWQARRDAEEARRAAEAAEAAADERALLGVEVHDLLRHSVSVMVVLAEGGAASVEGRPQAAIRAFDTIAGTGRHTLTELGGMVAVIRRDETPERRPVRGLGDLPELVQIMRAAGMAVTLRVSERAEVGPAIGSAVYQVVQESLTNALNHAPGQPVDVDITAGDDGLRVTVSNPVLVRRQRSVGAGHGLRSMRERARHVGGALTVDEDGDRWRVALAVPLNGLESADKKLGGQNAAKRAGDGAPSGAVAKRRKKDDGQVSR